METKTRSSQRFCRCGHARSLVYRVYVGQPRNICGVLACECVKHDTATTPKKAKLTVVEPSPNAMARDAAVILLKSALAHGGYVCDVRDDINAALACLEVIS